MTSNTTKEYQGWQIEIGKEDDKCSNYSFSITSPAGESQYVSMGGITVDRALERAKEMIDLEIELASG